MLPVDFKSFEELVQGIEDLPAPRALAKPPLKPRSCQRRGCTGMARTARGSTVAVDRGCLLRGRGHRRAGIDCRTGHDDAGRAAGGDYGGYAARPHGQAQGSQLRRTRISRFLPNCLPVTMPTNCRKTKSGSTKRQGQAKGGKRKAKTKAKPQKGKSAGKRNWAEDEEESAQEGAGWGDEDDFQW